MVMISDLPRDLIEEILSRISLKFMRAVSLTCKRWNTFSKEGSFSKMQIGKLEASTKEGEPQMIVEMNRDLYLMSVVTNGDPYIEPRGRSKLTCLTKQLKVKQVFNIEGLLLCIFEDDNKNIKFMVWNPYFLQPRWFKARCSYRSLIGCDPCFYDLGYVEKKNNKSRSHKFLRFVHIGLFDYPIYERFFWFEIYDFESDSWRTLDITPLWSIKFNDIGITVKGNTYWLVKYAYDYYIISFDFTKQRFGPLMHMPYNQVYGDVVLSCVREEKLATLVYRENLPIQDEFEIWITTEIETEKLSWSKFLTVNIGPKISCNLGSFIIDEEKKLVIGFNGKITIIGESGYFRELDLFKEPDEKYGYMHCWCAYVPSLVQIKQATECKRKKPDNEEKRRYDEKMLRLKKKCEELRSHKTHFSKQKRKRKKGHVFKLRRKYK